MANGIERGHAACGAAGSRQVLELADLIGRSALSPTDLGHLNLEDAFRNRFLAQGTDENRSLEKSVDRAWEVLLTLPRSQLGMIPADLLDSHAARQDEEPT
ncbi:ATP synthase beta subunit C-terminal domain-containing protein [Streptomyces sp. NPDC001340]